MKKEKLELKNWVERHPILTVVIILFLIGFIFGPISDLTSRDPPREQKLQEKSYLNSMQELNLNTGLTMKKLSSTSSKVAEGDISLNQSIELYEVYKAQFQKIKNEMVLLTPDLGFESIHQHHLKALNLLIEACDLTVQGIKQNNLLLVHKASDKINEASTEISTATELINSKY